MSTVRLLPPVGTTMPSQIHFGTTVVRPNGERELQIDSAYADSFIRGGWRLSDGVYTFAALPTPIPEMKGLRAFISDGAASPVFGAAAAGGGSKLTPVFCDGSSWWNG